MAVRHLQLQTGNPNRATALLPIRGPYWPLKWPEAGQYEKALDALACELDRTKDKERHRVAQQLHDGLGQDLIVTRLQLDELIGVLPQRYKRFADKLLESIDGLISQTRTILDDLYEQRVCETGLKAGLRALTGDLHRKFGLNFVLELNALPRQLPDEVPEIIFRAIKELLFNIVKHAAATKVTIRAACKSGNLEVEVSDNGSGFETEKTSLSELSIGRFGLFGVRSSLRAVGGTLRIFSHRGTGTRAIVALAVGPEKPL